MRAPVYVFDPTITDVHSRVRGIGRYLQILKENAPADWHFTGTLTGIPYHSILIQPFYTFFQKPLITRRITDRQIAVIHDLIPQKYPDHFPIGLHAMWHQFFAKRALSHFDYIVTDSEASRQDIHTFLKVPLTHIPVLYPTLAAVMWKAAQTHRPGAAGDYCLYVGDGTWNKNLVTLARAIKQTSYSCIFAGNIFADTDPTHYTDPWQEELQEFFLLTKNDKRFIFAGYVTDAELIKLYEQARVNILISRDEGFGFSYVESSIFGCPSLLADRPIFHEIAGDAAVFTDHNNPKAIADALTMFFTNDTLRADIQLRALEQSKKYNTHTFSTHLKQLVYPY